MRKQNHTLTQRCTAYILLVSLFLQNCTNPSLSLGPNKQEAIKGYQPQTSTGTATFIEVFNRATGLKEPQDKEGSVNQHADPLLGGSLPTTGKAQDTEGLYPGASSLPTALTQEQKLANKQVIAVVQPSQVTQFSPKLLPNQQTNSKPLASSLQIQKSYRQQAQQANSAIKSVIVDKALLPTKQVYKEASAKQGVASLEPGASYNTPLVSKGRFQIAFEKTSEGSWKAFVNEFFQVGISRRMELPVFFELGYQISHVADSHVVHIIEQGERSFIWVGSVGIKGGGNVGTKGARYQKEDDGNNNRSNSSKNTNRNSNTNSNNSKAKVTTQVIPSDISGKLKYLYQQDDTLPKLIEDEDIPAQRIQDYYVKLQVVLQESFGQESSAAAKDQVVGEKKPVEVDKLFDEIDKNHPAVSKVLLLGGAGIGKSTLMHYISYQWAHGKLWKDKYEHVFRVRLKDLLDPTWANKADKPDLLARFIYSCLDKQKTALAVKGNEQLDELGYDLNEIQQLLQDPHKKEKVLLLVDGYDEITSLKGKPDYQKIVDLGIFKHPQVIMTSRPNAASKEVRAKFERQVESKGLDEIGINQYISLQFKQKPSLGESLKDFLLNNSQVRSMCEVPINTALLCITWKDPAISTKLSSSTSIQTDFKLGQLYHELIVWLGKRYAIKYNPIYQNPKVLRELSDEAILEEEIFKALERIAYQAFTGIGLEDQARKGGNLGIPGYLVDQLARKEGKLSLSQLHQYGLLKGEGDPNKPLAQTYYFIHLTFQEYLTAHRLCKLLGQEDKAEVAEIATWIALHRNEPKYLMTFKFSAGLVSQSKDERLVKRFWEAMSCNVEGVIELGIEGKVKLFMHLLSQSKVGGEFDQRIPNLAQIEKLVNNNLQGDLVKWEQAITEVGYYPAWLQERASKGLAEGVELASKASLKEEDRMRLQAAANLLSKMVNQGGRLRREQLFDQFMELIALKDWQLQKLGLEKAREIVDQTVLGQKLEKSAKHIVHLLGDVNLEGAARGLFAKLCQIAPPVFKQIRPLLADDEYNVRHGAAEALIEIVKLVPELGKEVMEALKPLLAHSDEWVRRSAAYALKKIVQAAPELGKEVLEAFKPLLADSDEWVRNNAAEALIEIVKLLPELRKEVMGALKPLLAVWNKDVHSSAANALVEIVKLVPGKEELEALKPLLASSNDAVRIRATDAFKEIVKLVPGKEVFEVFKPLLAHSSEWVRARAAYAFEEIVPLMPELRKEVLEALKPLLADRNGYVRIHAANALKEIMPLVPELGKEAFEALKSLLTHSNECVSSAANSLVEIVKLVPGKEVLEAFKPLLAHSDEWVRRSAADALREIVKLVPELGKEAFEALKSLLAHSNECVSSAARALGAIVPLVPGLSKEVLEALKPLLAHSDVWVRRSAANALKEIMPLVPQLRKEVLEALKPLLADSDEDAQSSATDALIEIVKLVPELSKEVFEALKSLLADSDKHVRISPFYALEDIVKLAPELGKEVLETLKPLLADSDKDVRISTADTLKAMVPLVPELGKEVLEALKPLLADSSEFVRDSAARSLPAILRSVPGVGKEVFEALKILLTDKCYEVRRSAVYSLPELIKLVPEVGKEGMEVLKPLLADSDKWVRRSAADTLKEIVQAEPGLGKEVMEALKTLLADKDIFVLISSDTLKEIVQSAPELGKEVLEALKPLLADSNENVRSSAAKALGEIVPLLPFIEQVSLLTDAHPAVRYPAKKALAATLNSSTAIVQLNYQAVGSLLEIIRANRDQQEEVAKALYTGATKGLASIAENLQGEGLSWFHEHLNNLQSLNLPEGQAFLKAVIHHSLQDGVIDLQAAELLIKCIIERGLTAIINPQAHQITLEDNTYALQPTSQANLTHVVNEVIRLSTDPMAQQYKLHQPLFTNSGEGLPIATADIEKAGSILDKTVLNTDSWHVSVLDLSAHHHNKPSTTFILLEQRNYAGQHVIHQLKLDEGEGKAVSHAMNPLAVDPIRQALFGQLYVMNKSRYYGYSFTLSQQLGEKLIKSASQIKGVKDSYSVLHKLASDYQAVQENQERTANDLLSLPWDEYIKHPAVKAYKKEQLYEKEIGSPGTNVYINNVNIGKVYNF